MGLAGSDFVPRTPAYSMVNGTSGFVGARVVSDGARRIAVLNRTFSSAQLAVDLAVDARPPPPDAVPPDARLVDAACARLSANRKR